MISVEELNNRIVNKSKEIQNGNLTGYYPSVYHYLNTNCDILFVGLNPSAPDFQDIPKNKDEVPIEEMRKREQNLIHGRGPSREGQYGSYFSIFNKIEAQTNLSWEHIDLLHMRHTTQKDIEKYFSNNQKDLEFEIDMFKDVLKLFNTKVVFINNKTAGNLIKQYFSTNYDEKNDWHEVKLNNETKIFIFENSLQKQTYKKLTHQEIIEKQIPRLMRAANTNK